MNSTNSVNRPPASEERQLDALWIDYCVANYAYHCLPHNALPWERRAAFDRRHRALNAFKRVEDRVWQREALTQDQRQERQEQPRQRRKGGAQ